MRLIDADKLKAHYSWWEGEGEVDERKRLFDSIIDQQPTVEDAVVVTRCNNCRYYGPKYMRCGIFGCDKEATGYCDEAMRRRQADDVRG